MDKIFLSRAERESIRLGISANRSCRAIARELGRSPSTITREINRCGGRDVYQAYEAHRIAKKRRRRPKSYKLEKNRPLARIVRTDLRKRWSPEQISKRLRHDYPDDQKFRVSHETIYHSLFVQGRGGLLKELTSALRTGRAQRRRRGRNLAKPGRIAHMVNISERPAELEDRAVPGHWEGDLIIGKNSKSQVGTLVERTTRYLILIRLPTDRCASTVRKAIQNHIKFLPQNLKRSLTWDQGKEMAEHGLFEITTKIPVFFCDPHSPWQRGTNENTNGLVRQYLPKGTDLSIYTARQLRRISRSLNERPRETLNWRTPAEKLAELLR